jgi:2-hydroxy-6-oxonona-2,4-dienedioate hydrolase
MSIWTDFADLDVRQSFYDIGGIRTRVIEGGDPNNEALIFLHGTGGHAEAFTRNFRAHMPHFRTMSLDMLGHGYTDAPDIEYTFDALIDHLKAFVDTLGIEKVSLSGESLGAMIAAHFAIRFPDRTRAIVMNTGMLMDRKEEDLVGIRDLLERTKKVTGEVTKDAVRSRLAWLMLDPDKSVTDELVDVRYNIYRQPFRAEAMRRIMFMSAGGLLDADWRKKYSNEEDLRRIHCPVLVLWSDHNPGLKSHNAKEAMAYIENGEFIVMHDSAHWPQWEETDLFDRIHIKFLKSSE